MVVENINIGIIGEYDAERLSHRATDAAIKHAAAKLAVKADVTWIPTLSFLDGSGETLLEHYDGVWVSSGSPYRSMEGAIRGIQWARESGKPFIGT
jgi:CTP synthase (UTP-ammonia lyase)